MNIVSFMCPRPDHWRWGDYLSLLKVLQFSCDRFGQRHVVLTDDPSLPFEVFVRDAPKSLMPAFHFMQWKWLAEGDWRGQDTLFTGADCIINRPPDAAFAGDWDMCVTTRPYLSRPIITGAVVVRESAREKAAEMWRHMYEATDDRWGADLLVMAQALEPIPRTNKVAERCGMRVAFLDHERYNVKPKSVDDPLTDIPVVHFKGSFGLSKYRMIPWAQKHLGYTGVNTIEPGPAPEMPPGSVA